MNTSLHTLEQPGVTKLQQETEDLFEKLNKTIHLHAPGTPKRTKIR